MSIGKIESAKPAGIPVIDVSGLRGAPAERQAVARNLHKACTDTGFFYISGHGIPTALIEKLFRQSQLFFALPPEQKLALDMNTSPCRRGYEPLRAQTLEPDTPPDVKEGFLAGVDLPPEHPVVRDDPVNHGPNQWPGELPEFRNVMMHYLQEITQLSNLLIRGLALSLNLPEDYFDAYCDTPITILRLLHYPPQPLNAAPNEKGCGAHTDWGGITVLLQDSAGGLQVLSTGGSWVAAPPILGTFVVNIGDLFARWTNNFYRSTVHRVINLSGRDRYSVPFFFEGRSGHLVSSIPTCRQAGEMRQFPDVTVRGHLEEMARRTYAK
jgi:isopenicillin N synthase-like dioxygenase